MYDSPASLQSVCANYIGDNIQEFCQVGASIGLEFTLSLSHDINVTMQFLSLQINEKEEPITITFRDKSIYLHTSLSEQLLGILVEKGRLNDQTLSLFNRNNTRLQRVNLNSVSKLSRKGLRILQHHPILDLEASKLNKALVSISDLINSVSQWTLENLRSLNVSNCSFTDGSKVAAIVSLSRLKNLRVLNVSCTDFTNHGLEIIVDDLRYLECLDLSETQVTDISPLRKGRGRLRKLVMHNLKISDEAIPVIFDLAHLRWLDVSRNSDSLQQFYAFLDNFTPPTSLSANKLLVEPGALRQIEHLDISGCEQVDADALVRFIQCHSSLRFLGLLDCEACYEPVLAERASWATSLVVTCITQYKPIRYLIS